MFGVYEFLPSNELITMVGDTFCNDDALTQVLCTNVIFLITGFNKKQLNTVCYFELSNVSSIHWLFSFENKKTF